MKLYHTSSEKIEKINSYGVAGECLFFSVGDYYQMSDAAVNQYTIEIDEEAVVHVSQLHDESIIEEIAEEFEVDLDVAESLLDASDSEWNYDCDAEKSWWLQGKRGECAKKMGYEAVEDTDEQGIVYIVPMRDKEDRLILN